MIIKLFSGYLLILLWQRQRKTQLNIFSHKLYTMNGWVYDVCMEDTVINRIDLIKLRRSVLHAA